MNKLIKEVEFGELKFKISINRDIALKVSEKFPEFISRAIDASDRPSVKDAIKNGELRQLLNENDYINEMLPKIVEYVFPLILSEAGDKTKAEDIIKYAIENDADEILYSKIWEFILLGFTQREVKIPKISINIV